MRRTLLLALLLCALAAPALGQEDAAAEAAAQASAPSVTAEEGDAAAPFPLRLSASLTHSLGQGTFVLGYSGNPYLATSLSLSPSLALGDFNVSVAQGFELEWTQSDSTTHPNQLLYGDTELKGGYSGLRLKELGLSFPLSITFTLPISLASRHAGKLFGVSVGSQVAYSPSWLQGLRLSAGLGGGWNAIVRELAGRAALESVRPYEDRSRGIVVPSGCLRREAEEIANFACGAIPSVGGVSASLGASYAMLGGQLTFATSLGILSRFSYYWGPDDEYTSEHAKPGLGHREATTGSLSLAYSPFEWLTVSAGTYSLQPLVFAPGLYLRWFPYWDIFTPANNYSTFFVDTTFTY